MGALLDTLDKQLKQLSVKRNRALRAFRIRCKHLRLAEEKTHPPYRICVDCGATEVGWHCGYQVLTLQAERTDKVHPRGIVAPNIMRSELPIIKRSRNHGWPVYFVGQSHPNFSDKWDYKSLTAIPLEKESE